MQRIQTGIANAGGQASAGMLCFRLTIFLIYFGMSIALAFYSISPDGIQCLTRHSYTPRSLESHAASGMHAAAGASGSDREYRIKRGAAIFDPLDRRPLHGHLDSGLSMLPVRVHNATRDAAFVRTSLLSGLQGILTPENRLANALASLHIPGHGMPDMMEPNVMRCLNYTEHLTHNKTELQINIDKIESHPRVLGACLMSGQHRMVDVSSPGGASIVPFSTTNVLFMCMIVIWISASFALFSVSRVLKGLDSEFCGWSPAFLAQFAAGVCIVWNLGLFVICTVMIFLARIPANNAIIGAVASLVAVCVHMNMGAWEALTGSNRAAQSPDENQEKSFDQKGYFGGAHGQGSIPIVGVRYCVLEAQDQGYGSGVRSRRGWIPQAAASTLARAGGSVKGWHTRVGVALGARFSNTREAYGNEGDVSTLRFWEYAIANPIFFASLVAATSPSVSNPNVIAVYVLALGFALGTYASSTFMKIIVKAKKTSYEDALVIGVLVLLATTLLGCVLAFMLGIDPMAVHAEHDHSIYITLLVTHCLWLGFYVIIQLVVLGAYAQYQRNAQDKPTNWGSDEWDIEVFSVMALASINVAQKIAISSVVINTAVNGGFPFQWCKLWSEA